MIQFTYHPPVWGLLGAAAVLGLSFWLSYRSAKGKPKGGLRVLLIALRLLAIVAVVLCLLDPQWVEMIRHQQKSRVAVLVDTSRSMSIRDVPGTRLDSAKAWIKEKILPVVPSGVSISTYAFDQSLTPLPVVDSASPTGSVTALSETLEKMLNLPGEDPLLGVFLVSDGI